MSKKVWVIVLIAIAAAFGIFFSHCKKSAALTTECSFIKAETENTRVRVYIDTKKLNALGTYAENQESFKGWHNIDTAGEKYIKIASGIVGQDDFPFITLLRNDGTADYIDVVACMQNNSFNITGHLPLKDITDFEAAEVKDDLSGYHTIFAVHKDGRKTDLSAIW